MQSQRQEEKREQDPAGVQEVQAWPNRSLEDGHDYASYKEIFSGRSMPFAYLDLDLLEQNIRQVQARASGKRVRLASKSLRSVGVIRRILSAGSCFQGIMCYPPLEAVYLAKQGFEDLLIGYPTCHEQDIAAVA